MDKKNTHKRLISAMKKEDHVTQPKFTKVARHIQVASFDFQASFKDLLKDMSIFGDPRNLVVNQDDSFLFYKLTDGLLDKVMDGLFVTECISRYKLDPKVDFTFLIIFYCDKTGTNANQHYGVQGF
jgi:hypothetical protein